MTQANEVPSSDGEFLKGLMDTLKMNQQEFADRIQTSRVAVNQIVNGRRGVTPLMALKLEAALGVSAKALLERQALSDLDKAYSEHKDSIESIRANPIRPEERN